MLLTYDYKIFEFIHGFAGDSVALDLFGVFFAKYLPYFLLVYFFAYIIFSKRNWKLNFFEFAVAAFSCVLARGFITELFNIFYFRLRPPLVFGFDPLVQLSDLSSFPSGHATFYFALALSVFHFSKKRGWIYIISAVIIGISRIFVGVHFVSDILAGFVFGAMSYLVAWLVLRNQIRESKLKDNFYEEVALEK